VISTAEVYVRSSGLKLAGTSTFGAVILVPAIDNRVEKMDYFAQAQLLVPFSFFRQHRE
jgi:hypothetical protein